MQAQTNQRIFERPISTHPIVPDGTYDAQIESVQVREMDSLYHPGGKRTVANFKVEVTLPNGETVTLFVAPTFTWSLKGKFVQQLADLDALPKPGENLNLDRLAGMKVTVVVENTERDGQTYSNIVKMTKRRDDEQNPPAPKAPAPLPPKPRPPVAAKRVVKANPAENLFADEDDLTKASEGEEE